MVHFCPPLQTCIAVCLFNKSYSHDSLADRFFLNRTVPDRGEFVLTEAPLLAAWQNGRSVGWQLGGSGSPSIGSATSVTSFKKSGREAAGRLMEAEKPAALLPAEFVIDVRTKTGDPVSLRNATRTDSSNL
ncbi:unnamed protein product [Protopolystoma xenopodis]|uniref:Uncharacterized protein n=1 Tax=Protopolystoma xenopodis TaxID=117903 RepID=A0A448WQ38_9PLAT|nr:unnamed protein product [Protopolystoma xenopodis]